ncbi:MAG: type II toxin-antitoxin system VapC family toxin, partial [Pyrinomonadaceae bacterium]|nr:type II toxin-antitoxin system VapC family toxin [Pyrinomonadaceae bacterium]
KLSSRIAFEILNPANNLFLSIASVWEIQIKIQIGKFKFQDSLADVIAEQQQIKNIKILPIQNSHIIELENLPFHHKDPFDRIIIAQAKVENMTLKSADSKFSAYQTNLLW